MKKLFVMLISILLLTSCAKTSEDKLIKKFQNDVNSSKSYILKGSLEIINDEDNFSYSVEVGYKKKDMYKVKLVNAITNHEQVILKNKDGVYVITPSLNKSFKFQSEWPYNNSQIYLLQPIVSDLADDSTAKIEKTNTGYTITSKVNYTTEKDFKEQKVYVDNDYNIKMVEVLDQNGNMRMKLNITNIDYSPTFSDGYFDSSKYIKEDTDDNKEKTTAKIEDVVYPLYIPTDTYLTNQDKVSTNYGERVILTFSGEESFTVIQETVDDSKAVNYIYGDPYIILDTVGSITDSSVSWISNGIEYSIISDSMPVSELMTVAHSITVEASVK